MDFHFSLDPGVLYVSVLSTLMALLFIYLFFFVENDDDDDDFDDGFGI